MNAATSLTVTGHVSKAVIPDIGPEYLGTVLETAAGDRYFLHEPGQPEGEQSVLLSFADHDCAVNGSLSNSMNIVVLEIKATDGSMSHRFGFSAF
jgi:hypothetical protein